MIGAGLSSTHPKSSPGARWSNHGFSDRNRQPQLHLSPGGRHRWAGLAWDQPQDRRWGICRCSGPQRLGQNDPGPPAECLILPTGGQYALLGWIPRTGTPHRACAMVGMVFQNPEDQIVAALVEEDVGLWARKPGVPSAEIRARVERSCRRSSCGSTASARRTCSRPGQMQRLALAGVLVVEPRVVVFDETTAMLDPAGRQAVLERMPSAAPAAGSRSLTITHFMGRLPGPSA